MRYLTLLLVCCASIQFSASAQFTRYIIQFKDKQGSAFTLSNPAAFLSQRAIDRRNRYQIPVDETDLPVSASYLQTLQSIGGVNILNTSKWFNQVCVRLDDPAALTSINALPFVRASRPLAPRPAPSRVVADKFARESISSEALPQARPANPADRYNYGQASAQVRLHRTEFLHNLGFNGNGMRMAVMDGGFLNYLTLPTFDSVRTNNQILGTWDFVDNKQSVNEEHVHGMYCLSTIAANLPGSFVGTAPGASFFLFRTEDVSAEYPIEEQNFVAAAERADSAGVDVFSVSLGYNTFDNSQFDYTYADMNGRTALISRGCNMAARKGIGVVVAAGNAGLDAWRYITAPGDADSVLTAGAVNTSMTPANFSSYGPASDGRVKPDLVAVGSRTVIANANTGAPGFGSGTSYSCPILAGVYACLWQAFPEESNITLLDQLRKSAGNFAAPNDRIGYGAPDVKKAFVSLQKKGFSRQLGAAPGCKGLFNWSVKAGLGMRMVLERRLPEETDYKPVDTVVADGAFIRRDFFFEDDWSDLPDGINVSYRIGMQIGADTSYYLDSASIVFPGNCYPIPAKEVTLFPNPVHNNLNILAYRSAPATISAVVYNSAGQQVASLPVQPLRGRQQFILPLQPLSRGTYSVAVFIDNKRVLVQKIFRGN